MEGNRHDAGNGRRCNIAMFCGKTSLFVLMTGYAIFGAVLFKSLEGDSHTSSTGEFQRSREDCLKELWIITERLNVLYQQNWTKLVTEQLKKFERSVVESAKIDGHPDVSGPKWTFGGALLYTLTLLTTIGYGRLSPRTTIGKLAAIIYAIIGVPLMLILLSALGNSLANSAKKLYTKICCVKTKNTVKSPTVGYHKAPNSPTYEDSASIQLSSSHSSPNHVNCKQNYLDHREMPKRAILATVRASHSRGRCRQGPVRQILTDAPIVMCPTHGHHSTLVKNSSIVGISTDIDTDDTDDSEHVACSHDTPSRVPLIGRPPDRETSTLPTRASSTPTVPVIVALLIFFVYLTIGAATFATASGWSILDATYFCFVALSTIGVSDHLPADGDVQGQIQIFACCAYIVVGLVVVAMCFSLIHEEVTIKCRQLASNIGWGVQRQ